jgi:hypothetical protein
LANSTGLSPLKIAIYDAASAKILRLALGRVSYRHYLLEGHALQAAEKLKGAVILRSSGDEESRIALKTLRARSFAPLRMTALWGFSAACKARLVATSPPCAASCPRQLASADDGWNELYRLFSAGAQEIEIAPFICL